MEEIDILEFLRYYGSKYLIVALCTVLGLTASIIFSCSIQVPVYLSKTSLVLTNGDNTSSSITASDITLNKNLISTYRQIVKSRRILEQVIKNLRLTISYEALNKEVEVTSINDTEIIVISVYDENNEIAKKLADEIAKVFKKEIVDIYNIENVSIIDNALKSEKPANVHILKQLLIGIAVGFILGSSAIIFFYFIDDTIKKEEDIENKLGLNVLGSVPMYKKKKGAK